RGARVGRLEVLADLAERLGQRSGGEDDDLAADAGLAGVRGRSRLFIAITAAGEQQRGREDESQPGLHRCDLPLTPARTGGFSTTTVVDLMTATATEPTCRWSSSTASRLISDTIRNGPAWMST